jgi:hypothetical protein
MATTQPDLADFLIARVNQGGQDVLRAVRDLQPAIERALAAAEAERTKAKRP